MAHRCLKGGQKPFIKLIKRFLYEILEISLKTEIIKVLGRNKIVLGSPLCTLLSTDFSRTSEISIFSLIFFF